MEDERLQAVLDHVEQGRRPPAISFLTPVGVVQGIVVSEARFLDVTAKVLRAGARTEERGWFGRTPQDLDSRVSVAVENQVAAIGGMLPGTSTQVIHLAPARVAPSFGATLEIPALRVSKRAVVAWWLGDASVKNVKFSGVGFGFEF